MRPCPFCGERLRPLDTSGSLTGYSHPHNGGKCIFDGWFLGKDRIDRWENRAGIYMEIIDDHPVFNDEGRGKPISPKMLNDTIGYYRMKSE